MELAEAALVLRAQGAPRQLAARELRRDRRRARAYGTRRRGGSSRRRERARADHRPPIRVPRAERLHRTRCRSSGRRRSAAGPTTPVFRSLAGIGRWPHSGMPGPPTGPAFRSTITLEASQSSSGSSTRAARSWMSSNTTARPSCARRAGSAAEIFITAPSGHRLPPQHDERAALVEGVGRGPDHVRVPDLRAGDVLSHGRAGDGDRVEVEEPEPGELRHHGRKPTGVVEVLHQVRARRLQVHEPRRRAAELVEAAQWKLDFHAPRVRDQMEDCVGRARDRVQYADRVLEGIRGEDVRRRQVALDQLDDLPACGLRELLTGASRRPGSLRRRGASAPALP